MFVKRYFLFGAIVFIVSIKQGQSLECYNCNSHLDKECADDPVLEKFKTTCDGDRDLCRKIKQEIDFSVNGLGPDHRIIRSCGKQQGTNDIPNTCYKRSGFGGRQEVCACNNKDNCNVSSALYMSSTLLIGALLLAKSV